MGLFTCFSSGSVNSAPVPIWLASIAKAKVREKSGALNTRKLHSTVFNFTKALHTFRFTPNDALSVGGRLEGQVGWNTPVQNDGSIPLPQGTSEQHGDRMGRRNRLILHFGFRRCHSAMIHYTSQILDMDFYKLTLIETDD